MKVFEGAIVLDPTPGIYLDDPIAVLDFASLYPSCIIEKIVLMKRLSQIQSILND